MVNFIIKIYCLKNQFAYFDKILVYTSILMAVNTLKK